MEHIDDSNFLEADWAMSARDWRVGAAFFFDGEGSFTVSRNGAKYHKFVLSICQRVDRRSILDDLHAQFPWGSVTVQEMESRVSKTWGERAVWQIQDRRGAIEFLRAIAPIVRIKGEVVELAWDFLTHWAGPEVRVGPSGRIRRCITPEEFERRELLRERLSVANKTGPRRPVQLKLLATITAPNTMGIGFDPMLALAHSEHWGRLLTAEQVVELVTRYFDKDQPPISQAALGKKYGVSKRTINLILHGAIYSDVVPADLMPAPDADYRDRSRAAARRQRGPRTRKGHVSPLAKLDANGIKEVRRLRHEEHLSHRAIAARVGVSKPVVAGILNGTGYRGLTMQE